jgi:prepilin-type N-terminal cleavage/methylation domain-containing protein
MQRLDKQRGFTLVELAIVLTIIGLLLGGILKGQELIRNAGVTTTIAQVRAVEAAVSTFHDKYDATPGDMRNASVRLLDCPANCTDSFAGTVDGSVGDGIVGSRVWVGTQGAAAAVSAVANQATYRGNGQAATNLGDETALFWVHLLKANLISGVTDDYVAGPTTAPNNVMAGGTTHPKVKTGNAVFVAGHGNSAPLPGSPLGPNTGPNGMILVLASSPNDTIMSDTATAQPLTPTRAAQIDLKMDDGKPGQGYVQAYGFSTSCYNTNAPFSVQAPGYLENVTTNDCGLVFRIQG